MARTPIDKQGRRSERLSLAITAAEKADVDVVSAARGVKEKSQLLRDLSLTAIRREAKRLRSVLKIA